MVDLPGAMLLKKTDSSSHKSHLLLRATHRGWENISSYSPHARVMAGLILCRSHGGKDAYCVFTTLTTMSYPSNTTLLWSKCLLPLKISWFPLLWWNLSLGGSCVTYVWCLTEQSIDTYFMQFSQMGVSALATTHRAKQLLWCCLRARLPMGRNVWI